MYATIVCGGFGTVRASRLADRVMTGRLAHGQEVPERAVRVREEFAEWYSGIGAEVLDELHLVRGVDQQQASEPVLPPLPLLRRARMSEVRRP